jgi:hypothetical protein
LDTLEPYHPHRIIRVDRICIFVSAWFLVHIRENPSNIRIDAYILFHSDSMFTTNVEFAINRNVMVKYLIYNVGKNMGQAVFVEYMIPRRV